MEFPSNTPAISQDLGRYFVDAEKLCSNLAAQEE